MDTLLPPLPLFTAFLVASFVLAVTPGPGVVYVVTRSLSQGRSAGLASVMDVAAGNLCNAAGASLGLAALFAVSSFAFTVVKLLGAIYLVALGVLFVLMAAVTDTLYALSAGTVGPWLRRAPVVARVGRWLTGSVYVGLGLLSAVASRARS